MKASHQSIRHLTHQIETNMYLTYYAFIFALFALRKDERFVWLSLCALCLALKCNALFFDVTEIERYFVRTLLIFIFSHIILMKNFRLFSYSITIKQTKLCCYQAFILMLFLAANLALIYDVSKGKHIIIYNDFEAVIYGLVACQFSGVFFSTVSRVWNSVYNDRVSSNISSNKNKQVVDRV